MRQTTNDVNGIARDRAPSQGGTDDAEGMSAGAAFAIIFAVLLLVVGSVGGYYYYTTHHSGGADIMGGHTVQAVFVNPSYVNMC